MLNLPIKWLKTVELTAENIVIEIFNIDELVAEWDDFAKVTSRHLVIRTNCRDIDVSNSITQFLRFNGSEAMDYMYQRLSGVDAADSAGRVDGANAINIPPIPGAANDNVWGGSMVLIPHAFNTDNHKVLLALGGAAEFAVEAVVGRWAQAAAITSVGIVEGVGDEMMVGSTVSVGVIDESYRVGEVELAAPGTITFDNIPQGEGDLITIGYARTIRADVTDFYNMEINDDTNNANYWFQQLRGLGGATWGQSVNLRYIRELPGDNASANVFGATVICYSQYNKENQPHFLACSGFHESSVPSGFIYLQSGRRSNIEPINKIHYVPTNSASFTAGSLFSLYRVPKRIIERVIVPAGGQAIITFANIPQNFEDLILHIYARTDRADTSDAINIILNTDAVAANYDRQQLYGIAAAPTANRNLASQQIAYAAADNLAAAVFGGGSVLFPGYAKTDRHKHAISLQGVSEGIVLIESFRWESLNAINQIVLDPQFGANFLAGTVVELEGVLRKEGLPPDEGMQMGV